jgi:hypothetical protein
MKIQCFESDECSSEKDKNKRRSRNSMQKEGFSASYLHYLANKLTHDPREEIQGALEDIVAVTPDELRKESSVIEICVQDASACAEGSTAQYQVITAALPENYAREYAVATRKEDDQPQVSHAFNPDVAVQDAAQAYGRELDAQIWAKILNIGHVEIYPTAEKATRVEHYKLALGWAMRFLLYSIKSASN